MIKRTALLLSLLACAACEPEGVTVEASRSPNLQYAPQQPGAPREGAVETAVSSEINECTGPTIEVNPNNINSKLRQHDNVVLRLEPGIYDGIRPDDFRGRQCVQLQCRVPAIIDGAPNPDGCRFVGQITPMRNETVIIEDMVIDVNNTIPPAVINGVKQSQAWDYGIRAYRVDALRIARNSFTGTNNHDISTKQLVGYTEILDNLFVECGRHCIELGQNGNTPGCPTTGEKTIVKGNVFDSPMINAITQRYNLRLIVSENEFRNVGNNTVHNWPFWKRFNCGRGNEKLLVPSPSPLRTEVVNNTFVGSNRLRFEGRGVADDSVLVRRNSGGASCSRPSMRSDAAAVHTDLETTDPPRLDPASDVSC
jgi:hypothetical protein